MRSFRVVAGQTGFPSQFDNLRHDARGGAFLSAHQQLGALALPTTPTNGQTITLTVNGNAIILTAVTGTPTNPGDVKAPGTAAAFATNVLALLNQPQTTTANAIALSAADQQLLSYFSFSLVGTTITFSSANNSIFAPLSSFTASTTVTGASWTAQTMQLYVESGVVYVSGTRVIFSGGSTPTVTAPSSHPRIDVLTIDNTGTLAWTTGTENASPVAPTYPANKVALCELYNIVGETALYDYENQTSGQGYVYSDVRSFLQPSMNWGAFSTDLIPDGDGIRNLGSAIFEWENLYVKNGIFLNGSSISQAVTYVGTAGESISAGAAVAIADLPNDGGPLLDTATSGNFSGTGATIPLTVGNNANRLLIVCLWSTSSSGAAGSNAAYNSSALTTVQSAGGSTFNTSLMAYLIAPSIGANNLVFSGLASATWSYSIHSYYNMAQSSVLDTSALKQTASAGTMTQSITPTNPAALLFALASNGATSATNFPNNPETNGNLYAGDAGVYLPPGGWTASATFTGTPNANLIVAAFKPAGTPISTIFNASSAANQGNGRFASFIGIAVASATKGQVITAYVAGIASGLSSLTIGQQYYVNDTNGTVGTSPGTNTRKAGIAISPTQLLITNTW